MLEQVLKAERKRDAKLDTDRDGAPAKRKRKRDDDDDRDGAPAKRKRKRDDDDDDDDRDGEPEASATPKSDAASSSTNAFDGTMLVQLLQQLAGNALPGSAGVSTGTEPAPADPRAAERARIAAEKEAKKAEKKEAAAVAKAADLEKRKATQDVGLAAKVQVLLAPVAEALKAIEIKDDLEAVVKEPLLQAKDTIAKYMKEAAAMQAAAKKKGFGIGGHRLDWTQKDVSTAVASAKEAMKKHEQFMRMFRT